MDEHFTERLVNMNQPHVIVNVRGTSGSGKSTLVRAIMTLYPFKTPVCIPGRKQPLYYVLSHNSPDHLPLVVLGHYEGACGGCDTISKDDTGQGNSYDRIFGLVRELYNKGFNVLFEGLLISGDAARCTDLHKTGYPINVVPIELPIEVCIQSVLDRRAAKGNTKHFNDKNTREKHRLMSKCIDKLMAAGVPVHRSPSREAALRNVGVLLGVHPDETATLDGSGQDGPVGGAGDDRLVD